MDQILEEGSPLLNVLIELLEIEDSDCYAQLEFWRSFLRKISKVPDEAARIAKFQLFENVVIKLVDLIVKRAKMDQETFKGLNNQPADSSDFE